MAHKQRQYTMNKDVLVVEQGETDESLVARLGSTIENRLRVEGS
jgi:hypothetical protein